MDRTHCPTLIPAGALFIAALASPAWADWACTMPNGKTIYNKLSGCPPDAVSATQTDATPSHIKPEFKGTYTPPMASPEPIAKKTQPKAPRDIVDEAYAVCALLKTVGATTCKVEVNIFSASYIDATLPGSAKAAQLICLGITNFTRQPDSPFIGQGWQLKLFSPYGSDTRPIAACTL